MKQNELPKFVSIQFYPGYSYSVGTTVSTAAGRYVALADNGRAFVKSMDSDRWVLID